MKNTWKRFIAVAMLLGASSMLGARASVSVYAEETAPAETNAASTTTHKASADADHPPVRIDETGVHVGGANRVDINAPDTAGGRGGFAARVLQNLTGMLAIIGTF